MSIFVNIYYTGKEGSAREFVREMEESGIADTVRKQPGNLAYDYFFSAKDPETVLLVDAWKDQAALDAHHAADWMPKISALRDKHGLSIQAKRFREDVDGFTDNDLAFLKTKADA